MDSRLTNCGVTGLNSFNSPWSPTTRALISSRRADHSEQRTCPVWPAANRSSAVIARSIWGLRELGAAGAPSGLCPAEGAADVDRVTAGAHKRAPGEWVVVGDVGELRQRKPQ